MSDAEANSGGSEEEYLDGLSEDVRGILELEHSHISRVTLLEHLRHFYLAHNPRILQSPEFLQQLVQLFEGRERELFDKLQETYKSSDRFDRFIALAYNRSQGKKGTGTGGVGVGAGGAGVGAATGLGVGMAASFLDRITMEGMLYRKPTRKGVRGKVQEIMQPHPRWFELSGCLLVWSKGPKHNPRGRMRLQPTMRVEAVGERNFRIKVEDKIILACQTKHRETREEWIAKLGNSLELLTLEARLAEVARRTDPPNGKNDSALMDVSASIIEPVDSDDEEADGAATDRASASTVSTAHQRRRRTGRRHPHHLHHEEESSSDEGEGEGDQSAPEQSVVSVSSGTGNVIQIAVAPTLVDNADSKAAVSSYNKGVRTSLHMAKRKVLAATGLVAVASFTMQFYGLAPLLVSALVATLCIYGRFLDGQGAPPTAEGTIVLSAAQGIAPTVSSVTLPGASQPSQVTAGAAGGTSPRRKPRRKRSIGRPRGRHRNPIIDKKRRHAHGNGADSSDADFADCVGTPGEKPEEVGGGATKDEEGGEEKVPDGPAALPPLHLYGDLGIRFLPTEPNLTPRGLSFKLNDDYHPVAFETPFFKGRMVLRIKNAIGAAKTEYFDGKRRLFSIQIEGRFQQRLRTDKVYFGSSFKHKLTIPGYGPVAINILKSIDSALQEDIFAEKNPWIMSPLICAVERLQVRRPDPNDQEFNGVGPWRYGGSESIEEDSLLLIPEEKRTKFGSKSWSFGQRRKYFADRKKREATFWEPDLVYTFDFLSARMDFNTYKVHMARFINFGTTKLMNKQPFQLEARVMGEGNEKVGSMWSFEFCHNKVAPFPDDMEVIDHSNDR